MDRKIIYSMQLPLSADTLNLQKNMLKALGQLAADVMTSASTTALITGLACTPTTPASLGVLLAPGTVYQQTAIDMVTPSGGGAASLQAYGSLAADSTSVLLQGFSTASQTVTGFAAPGVAGQSINYLIEAQVQNQDGTPAVLNYYNSANPQVPLIGPSGAGTPQNTDRKTVLAVKVVAGTAAATGTQTTPGVDAGWLPAYVVTVAFGQTTVLAGNIAVHSSAPFLASLTSQHHTGKPGAAPKIDLTTEVQNVLPATNVAALPVGNLQDLACSAGAGLNLNYNGAPNFDLGGTPTAIAAGALVLPANSTCYVYVNNSGVVASNTTGWGTDGTTFPMALVVTASASITSVTDKRSWARGLSIAPIQSVNGKSGPAVTVKGSDIQVSPSDTRTLDVAIAAAGGGATPIRNTVISAAVDSNGRPDFIKAGVTIKNATPIMTAATTSGVTYSATSEQTGREAWRAGDGDGTVTLWETANGVTTGTLTVDFGATTKAFYGYMIMGNSTAPTRNAKNYTVDVWNGSAWVNAETATNRNDTALTTYAFASVTSGTKMRIVVTANNGATDNLDMFEFTPLERVLNSSALNAADLKATATPVIATVAAGVDSTTGKPTDNALVISADASPAGWANLGNHKALWLYMERTGLNAANYGVSRQVRYVPMGGLPTIESLTATPTIYYTGDDYTGGSGTSPASIVDSRAFQNGAISGTVKIIQGPYGRGMLFDGVTGYAATTFKPNYTAYSFAGLIRLDKGGVAQCLYSDLDAANTVATIRLRTYVNTSNQPVVSIGNGSTITDHTCTAFAFQVGVPVHYVATVDGTNVKFYINGVLVQTVAQTTTLPGTASGGNLTFGRNGDNASSYFQGFMDEIRVYNTAVSAAEVAQIYNSIFSKDGDHVITMPDQSTYVRSAGAWSKVNRFFPALVTTDASGNIVDCKTQSIGRATLTGNISAPMGSSVRAVKSATQSISSATYTKLTFDTAIKDTQGEWSATNSAFTPKEGGRFAVNVGVEFGASVASGTSILLNVYVNGTPYKMLFYINVAVASAPIFVGYGFVDLQPGDTVEIYLRVGASTSITTTSSNTFLEVQKIA